MSSPGAEDVFPSSWFLSGEREEERVFEFVEDPSPADPPSSPPLRISVLAMGRHLQHVATAIGKQVWPAAEVLCQYLVANKSVVTSRSVLELGAGIGLCGLLAARYASSVVLTDHLEELMPLLECNIARNRALLAPNPNDVSALQRQCGRNSWDLIIASDVVYAAPAVRPLFESVGALLGPGGRFVLANHVIRLGPNLDAFYAAIAAAGLRLEDVPLERFQCTVREPVRLMVFTRQESS